MFQKLTKPLKKWLFSWLDFWDVSCYTSLLYLKYKYRSSLSTVQDYEELSPKLLHRPDAGFGLVSSRL